MHRKILVTIGLAGCAGYLVAQAALGSETESPQIAQRVDGGVYQALGGGRAAAIPHRPLNAVQTALDHYIIAATNAFIDKAEEQGRNAVVSKIIEAQCYHILTFRDPAQRKHEIDGVWQVSVWRPNGAWDHVTSAPIKVSAILNLTEQQEKKIRAIHDKIVDDHMERFMAISRRLSEKGLTGDAHRIAYQQELERMWEGRPKSERSATYALALRQGSSQIRALLTLEQQREWDLVQTSSEIDLKKAFEGSASPPGSR